MYLSIMNSFKRSEEALYDDITSEVLLVANVCIFFKSSALAEHFFLKQKLISKNHIQKLYSQTRLYI